jgi:hypothetical protein
MTLNLQDYVNQKVRVELENEEIIQDVLIYHKDTNTYRFSSYTDTYLQFFRHGENAKSHLCPAISKIELVHEMKKDSLQEVLENVYRILKKELYDNDDKVDDVLYLLNKDAKEIVEKVEKELSKEKLLNEIKELEDKLFLLRKEYNSF